MMVEIILCKKEENKSKRELSPQKSKDKYMRAIKHLVMQCAMKF